MLSLLRFFAYVYLVYISVRWMRALLHAGMEEPSGRGPRRRTRRSAGTYDPWEAAGFRMPPPPPPSAPPPPPEPEERSPFAVLGIERGSSWSEVQRAYRRQVQQYHPDQLAQMAPELRDLAEQRTKEINAAYAAIKLLHR